jgi:hypothetical protein
MYKPMRANIGHVDNHFNTAINYISFNFKILSDLVTSLNKVKSNMTVPYIELLNCVPAKPTSDVASDSQPMTLRSQIESCSGLSLSAHPVPYCHALPD